MLRHLSAEEEKTANTRTMSSVALDSGQLHADGKVVTSRQGGHFTFSDEQMSSQQTTPANPAAECYTISADEPKVHEDARRGSDNSEESAGEEPRSKTISLECLQGGHPPSLVSIFRLSTESTSSASSSWARAIDCSPRSVVDTCQTDSSFSQTQNEGLSDELVGENQYAHAMQAHLLRGWTVYKETNKAFASRPGRRVPLARMLLALSHACAETSFSLHTLVGSEARSELESPASSQDERLSTTDADTYYNDLQLSSVRGRRKLAVQEGAATEVVHVRHSRAAGEVSHAYLRTPSVSHFTEQSSMRCANGTSSAAEPLLDCLCFGRRRFAFPSYCKYAPSSHGAFTAMARATGQVLALASAVVARAAAAAAAAVDDDSDSGTDHSVGEYSGSEGDSDDVEERFVFTSTATPFAFVLWASKGAQLLLKSPLGNSTAETAVSPSLTDLSHKDNTIPPRNRKLQQKKTQVHCFRAVALRLLLLICRNAPGWHPEKQGAFTSLLSHKVNGEPRTRRNLSADGHRSHVTGDEADSRTRERGVFGCLLRKNADVLWQRWKRTAASERASLQSKAARLCFDPPMAVDGNQRRQWYAHDLKKSTTEIQHQTGDNYIWHAARRMLRVDSQLARLWMAKVPGTVSNEDFWKEYFYQVFHVMKRCELQANPRMRISTHACHRSKRVTADTAGKLAQRRRHRRKRPSWPRCQRLVSATASAPTDKTRSTLRGTQG